MISYKKLYLASGLLILACILNIPVYSVTGISAAKLAVPIVDPVPVGGLEFEPALGIDWGLGSGSLRTTEFGNRLTWGVAPNLEIGFNMTLIPDGSQEFAFGLKWFFIPIKESLGFAFMTGGTLPTATNAASWEGGLIFSAPFSETVHLDISTDFALDQQASLVGNYNLTSNIGLGWYFVDTVQACFEFEHNYNFIENAHSITGLIGITWDLNDDVILVFGQGINFLNPVNTIETNSFFAATIAFFKPEESDEKVNEGILGPAGGKGLQK